MTEKINTSELYNEVQKTAEFDGGTIDYSVIGEPTKHNPVVLVPGFTISRLVQRDFAQALQVEGDRQVIFSEQPDFSYKPSMKKVIDRHAEALLAVLREENLQDQPVDFIAHSMGSIIFTRAAEMAKERGLLSFGSGTGSHAIFISPAGTNDAENVFRLGKRFVKFMKNGAPLGKELDPDGAWMKEGTKNFIKRPIKTAKEIAILSKKEAIYKRLGELGIRPALIGYPSDDLMSFTTSESVVMSEDFKGGGYSVPIDTEYEILESAELGTDFKKYKEATGLDKEQATKSWARHVLGAGHNDLLFNPERTVRAVLPILNEQVVINGKEVPVNKPTKSTTRNRVRLTL